MIKIDLLVGSGALFLASAFYTFLAVVEILLLLFIHRVRARKLVNAIIIEVLIIEAFIRGQLVEANAKLLETAEVKPKGLLQHRVPCIDEGERADPENGPFSSEGNGRKYEILDGPTLSVMVSIDCQGQRRREGKSSLRVKTRPRFFNEPFNLRNEGIIQEQTNGRNAHQVVHEAHRLQLARGHGEPGDKNNNDEAPLEGNRHFALLDLSSEVREELIETKDGSNWNQHPELPGLNAVLVVHWILRRHDCRRDESTGWLIGWVFWIRQNVLNAKKGLV